MAQCDAARRLALCKGAQHSADSHHSPSDVPESCCYLFPVGDGAIMPANKAKAAVLGDNEGQRVVHRLAQPIRGAMACSDAIGSHPVPFGALEVVRVCDAEDLRQVTSDLGAEPDD